MSRLMDLSAAQLSTLRHMLGIDLPLCRQPIPSRNYYCAPPGDEPLRALQACGAVRMYQYSECCEWWCCTDAGRAAAMASHRTIRRPKGARLYARFLDLKDCWPDLDFHRFLTDPSLRRLRQEA